jgi:hypothetical protein
MRALSRFAPGRTTGATAHDRIAGKFCAGTADGPEIAHLAAQARPATLARCHDGNWNAGRFE